MSNSILPNINDLIKLEEYELSELLLENRFNKPMLRELIRRCVKEISENKKLIDDLINENSLIGYSNKDLLKELLERENE